MGTIYELILGSFFGPSVPLFWVPRFGFGLAPGFSGRDLVEDFYGCSAPTDLGQAKADPFPATDWLDQGSCVHPKIAPR